MKINCLSYSGISLLLIVVGLTLPVLEGCSFTPPFIQTDRPEIKEPWSPSENLEAAEKIAYRQNDAESKSSYKKSQDTPGNGYPMELWNDPTFQRQFMGSYGIKTEIEPEVTAVERETLSQVLNFMSEENMDQARKLLEKTITPNTSALFDFILGNILFQNDELTKAANRYEIAIAKFPDFLRAHKNIAMVKVRSGEFQEALKSLTRTIELGEGTALTYGLMGYAYTSVENHLNAETAYRRAMMLQPDSTDWQLGLAQSLFKQRKYADAASLCNQLIAQNPDNNDYWRLQANAYLGLGESLKAAQNYEYLRSMGTADIHSLNKLGDIYVQEKMLDMAAEAYAEALGKKDTDKSPDSFIRNARVLASYGGLDEAGQVVEKIKEVFTDSLSESQEVELLRLEARIALKKGANEKQAALLREIVRIDPMDGEALVLLGQYYERKNNPEKAVFYYERAEGIESVEAKAKIRHAQLLVQRSKYQEAIPLLESALRIEHRPEVEDYLAQVKAAAKSGQ